MENLLKILKKIICYAATVAIVLWVVILSMLLYDYNHPRICNYKYVDMGGVTGVAKECGVGKTGTKYCRLEDRKANKVMSFEKVCRRG